MTRWPVFISHDSRDAILVSLLAQLLKEALEVECEFSSDTSPIGGIKPGERWRNWIPETIKGSGAVLFVLTPRGQRNSWVMYELGLAVALCPDNLIPVRAGVSADEMPQQMAEMKAIDVLNAGGLHQLLSHVAGLCNRPLSPRSPELVSEFLREVNLRFKLPDAEWTRELEKSFARTAELYGRVRHLNNEIARRFKRLSEGDYVVVGSRRVYEHDTLALDSLTGEDFYYATHPVEANPGAILNPRSDTGIIFRDYIEAQKRARKRNVRVVRLYAVSDNRNIHHESLNQHFHELHEAGIEVYVSSINHFRNDGLADDFVILGKQCLGTAVPEQGPMIGSRYRFRTEASDDDFRQHMSWFEAALRHSSTKKYQPEKRATLRVLNESHTRPAFMLETGVHLAGRPAQRLMLVLRTNGCVYDTGKKGCKMCGFRAHATDAPVSTEELLAQLELGLATIRSKPEIRQLDLLSLGSILHAQEVPRSFLYAAVDRLAGEDQIRKIVVESRYEYVSAKLLASLRSRLQPGQTLELGLGVETTNDDLRTRLNKGLPREGIFRTMDACAEAGVHFQPYLLIGTPGLKGSMAADDAVRSAEEIASWCAARELPFRIAFEPVFITPKTELERQFQAGKYRLVNLWTVVDVLRRTHHLGTVFVGLSDENLSDNRIPAGCDDCTARVRRAIEQFNQDQDVAIFDKEACARCNPIR